MNVVKSKRCDDPGCNKQPSFGVEGTRTALFCAGHNKKEGMVDIRSRRRCGHPGCNKHAARGLEGSKTRKLCAGHKKEGMVNVVKSKRCDEPSCKKQSSFGVEGTRTALFCAGHKKEGMVDIRSRRRCSHPGCNKQPSCGVAGSKTRELCAQHAKQGMVHVGRHTGSAGDANGQGDAAMDRRVDHTAAGNKRKVRVPRPAQEDMSSASERAGRRSQTAEEELLAVTNAAYGAAHERLALEEGMPRGKSPAAAVKVEESLADFTLPGATEAVRYHVHVGSISSLGKSASLCLGRCLKLMRCCLLTDLAHHQQLAVYQCISSDGFTNLLP